MPFSVTHSSTEIGSSDHPAMGREWRFVSYRSSNCYATSSPQRRKGRSRWS